MIEQFINELNKQSIDISLPYVILDIGSRDCEQSIEFINIFPNANVYAFECNPQTLPLCRTAAEKYSNLTLIDKAVNLYDGSCTFYPINPTKTLTTWKDGNPGASSLFKSNGQYTVEHYVQDMIEISCCRIDTALKSYNVNQIDIIWMDLQGAELLALQSMGDLLSTVKYIHTEVSFRAMYENQVMFNELNSFLIERGFIIIKMPSQHGWQDDIIYKNSKI